MSVRRPPQSQIPKPRGQQEVVQSVLDGELPESKGAPFENAFYDITGRLPLQTQTESTTRQKFFPITKTDQEIFFTTPLASEWIDAHRSGLSLKMKLWTDATKATPIPAATKFQLVDNLALNVFKRIKVECMGTTVTPTNQYGGIGKTMMDYAFGDLNAASQYYQQALTTDDPFKKNSVEVDPTEATFNKGAARRRLLFAAVDEAYPRDGSLVPTKPYSGEPELFLPLWKLSEWFYSAHGIIPGLNFNMTLYPQDARYVFLAEDNTATLVYEITECILWLDYLKPNPSIDAYITSSLFENKLAAAYDIQTVSIRIFTLQAGLYEFQKFQLFENSTPNIFLWAMVRSASRMGEYKSNPFQFETFDLNQIQVFNGSTLVQPIESPDTKGDYAACVENLYRALGINFDRKSIIDRYSFRGGYGIFGYCFTSDGQYKPLQRKEGINTGGSPAGINIKFGTALPVNVDLVCLGLFDNTISVDGGRNVVLENSV